MWCGTSLRVALELNVHDLTQGEHAIHFHHIPKCGAGFEGKKHGFDNPDGDMKNFTVEADGKAKLKVEDADVTLKEGPHSLLANGAAIVVHAKGDDYNTDPAGNSGDRVACE